MFAKIILWGMVLAIDLLVCYPSWSQSSWVDKLRNANENVCCYDNDGRRLDDPDWDTLGKVGTERTEGSGYRVFEDNKWHEVPNWAVVTMRNQSRWYFASMVE